MKKLLLTSCLSIIFVTISLAQLEVKAKVVPFFHKKVGISVEYIIGEKFGIEANFHMLYGHVVATSFEHFAENSESPDRDQEFRLKKDGYRAWVGIKHYFSPDNYGDGIYIGGFLGQRNLKASDYPDHNTFYFYDRDFDFQSITGGGMFGFKGVFKKNITIDMNGALGIFFKNKITFADPNGDVSSFEWGEIFFNLTVGYRFNVGNSEN